MAAEGITLVCTECKMENYRKLKNKKTNPERLSLMKYCPKCKKAVLHTEKKK